MTATERRYQLSPSNILLWILIGGIIGYLIHILLTGKNVKNAEIKSRQILAQTEAEVSRRKKELEIETKEALFKLRSDVDRETKEERRQLQALEQRLSQRETNQERKLAFLDKKEQDLSQQEKTLTENTKAIAQKEQELSGILEEEKSRLSRVANLSREEAREILISKMEDEARHDAAVRLKRIEDETREESDRISRTIVLEAIQRCASEQSESSTTSVVSLPSDEMKGRLIGREGRNIRAFEAATGVDLIVDDTPEAVTISAFNIYRRAIARMVLERLISDGRIHP
ncbi:MAG: Rnase Y domain-containing protein, partial [Candidatus Omnitrophica bacterium]|nr:Rnase Y domain-containing protein [Candidatus Omnitrophota bacterium]